MTGKRIHDCFWSILLEAHKIVSTAKFSVESSVLKKWKIGLPSNASLASVIRITIPLAYEKLSFNLYQ